MQLPAVRLHDGAGAVGRAVIADDHRVRHGRRHVRRVAAAAVAWRPRRALARRRFSWLRWRRCRWWRRCWLRLASTVRCGAAARPRRLWTRIWVRIRVYHLAWGWLWLGLGLGLRRFGLLFWRRRWQLGRRAPTTVWCGAAARPSGLWARI